MRSILTVVGLFVVMGMATACGQILGIEPWEDPAFEGGSSSSTGATYASSSSSSGNSDPCSNGVQDGTETGVDCGGVACGACDNGRGCSVDADCISNRCPPTRGYCLSPEAVTSCAVEDPENANCGDCAQNGTETDIDCGGGCLPCRPEQKCVSDGDCWSNSCLGGECSAGGAKTLCFSNTDCMSGMCAAATAECAYKNCCQ